MKHILLVAILVVVSAAGVAQAGQNPLGPFETDLKVNEIASLPQGLTVVHSPITDEDRTDGPTGTKWTHSTTVTSTVGPVTIVEFGCLYDTGDRWVLATVSKAPYTSANFAQWYGCPSAELQSGVSYSDASNFTMGSGSPGRVTKWYFIGVDAQGNRVKGEAEVALPSSDLCWTSGMSCIMDLGWAIACV
jgi:hypothetical protein